MLKDLFERKKVDILKNTLIETEYRLRGIDLLYTTRNMYLSNLLRFGFSKIFQQAKSKQIADKLNDFSLNLYKDFHVNCLNTFYEYSHLKDSFNPNSLNAFIGGNSGLAEELEINANNKNEDSKENLVSEGFDYRLSNFIF